MGTCAFFSGRAIRWDLAAGDPADPGCHRLSLRADRRVPLDRSAGDAADAAALSRGGAHRPADRGSCEKRDLAREACSTRLVIGKSEDNRFCQHHGIDWGAVSDAVDDYDAEGRLRGASTITMQVARNLFLWPGGGFLRKGVEASLALTIDALWPKRRILEIYLNIAEWGDGIYGAEAASRVYFRLHAAQLSRHDAALLAVVLPSPRRWSPARPTRYIADRAAAIAARIDGSTGITPCLRQTLRRTACRCRYRVAAACRRLRNARAAPWTCWPTAWMSRKRRSNGLPTKIAVAPAA